jgi:predicted Zn-dependent peptidase
VAHEIVELAAGRFRDGEVARARDSLKARLLLTMDSTAARMSRLGRSLVSGVELLADEEVARRIDAVGEEDVHALAATLSAPPMLSVAGIGPDEEGFLRAVEVLREANGGGA